MFFDMNLAVFSIDAIKASGIEAVLNLCAECYDLHEIEAAQGLDVHWLPITDEDAPQLEDAQKAIDWLNSKIGAGKKALIHCRFGIGRTGTMAMAWLVGQGYAADQAQELLGHTPSEPKSRRQWDFFGCIQQVDRSYCNKAATRS
jgi:protein-tyrosine phosphatase